MISPTGFCGNNPTTTLPRLKEGVFKLGMNENEESIIGQRKIRGQKSEDRGYRGEHISIYMIHIQHTKYLFVNICLKSIEQSYYKIIIDSTMFIRKWRERKSRTASPSYSVSSPQCKKKRKSDRGRRSNRSPMNCKTELEPKVPKRSVTQGRISEDLKSFDTRHGTPKAKGNMPITKCKRSRVSQRPEESENNDDTSFALPFSIEFLSLVLPRNTEQARVGKFPPMASESDIFNYEDISIISGQTELAEYRVQETIKSTSNIDQFFTSSPQSVDAFQSPINVDFALESSEDELARFVNACIHSGKLNDAIDIYETVLNHCKNINGKDRLLISSIHNLGIIHTWNRQYDRALFYCTKALKMRRRKYGNHSTEVTSSLCELSIIHYARENFNKALGTLREALQIESLAANRVDNRICSILNNIGCIHFSMGKMNSSLTTLEECLDLQRRLMGKATGKNVDRVLLNMSIVLTNMATVTAKQGDLIDAASLMEQGLIVQQSILPDDHRIISSVKKVLFRLEGNQGDSNVMDLEVQVHQKAVVSEDQTIPNIQVCTDVLSLGLPGTTLNTQQMIQLNLNISGLPQILELEGRSKQHCSWVDIRRQEKLILEEDEFNFFRTCKKAAKLIKADKIDKAIELIQTIRRSHSNKVGDVEFILGALRHVLGLIYLCTEKYQQAIVCFRDSIKMRTDVLDENHVEVLVSARIRTHHHYLKNKLTCPF